MISILNNLHKFQIPQEYNNGSLILSPIVSGTNRLTLGHVVKLDILQYLVRIALGLQALLEQQLTRIEDAES